MPRETKTPKPVDVTPEIKTEKPVSQDSLTEDQKKIVTIIIDRRRTSGGLRVNGKLYVGEVTVPKHQADDLLRMQEEYDETMQKIVDPTVSVRMKNDLQKEALFLADPKVHGTKPNFTRDYGLLPLQEWEYCTPEFQKQLLDLRKQLYGY